MPRHQTSRQIGEVTAPSEKLDILREYARISNRVQEYGSAGLAAIEAIFVIISCAFLFPNMLDLYPNYASYFLIVAQAISLIPNCLDLYELLGFLKKNPTKLTEFTVASHLIVVSSYIIGTLLIICGSVFTLNYVKAYQAAPWIYLGGSIFFAVGAVFGASDSLIKANPFLLFFGSLFGKCMIVGTFAFLFGSVLGVIKIWADIWQPGGGLLIGFILAGTFQTGGLFFLIGAALSIVMITYKNVHRDDESKSEKTSLINEGNSTLKSSATQYDQH